MTIRFIPKNIGICNTFWAQVHTNTYGLKVTTFEEETLAMLNDIGSRVRPIEYVGLSGNGRESPTIIGH